MSANRNDVRKIDEISNSHFNFSSNRSALILILIYVFCWNFYMPLTQRVLFDITSSTKKNWMKKMEIVSAWKRAGENRIKEEREKEKSTFEREEKFVLFRFDGNNKLPMILWMIHIKYPLRLLRESAFNDDINLLYIVRDFFLFTSLFPELIAFSFQLLFAVCACDAWNWNCQNLLCCMGVDTFAWDKHLSHIIIPEIMVYDFLCSQWHVSINESFTPRVGTGWDRSGRSSSGDCN